MNKTNVEKPIADVDAVVEMTAATMLGELMAISMDACKSMPDIWPKMTQVGQDMIIGTVSERVKRAVRNAVLLISSQGFTRVPATLEQVVAKDGLKATVIPSAYGEARHALLDAVGQAITIVLADPSQFVDAKHGHKSQPDQADLPIDDSPINTIGDDEELEEAA